MCCELRHEGHGICELSDLAAFHHTKIRGDMLQNESLQDTLSALISSVPSQIADLHTYIDGELEQLEQVVGEKRVALQLEVNERHYAMKESLEKEMELCRTELEALKRGQLVFETMAKREGIVPGGQLIQGQMTYSQFISEVDVDIHEPEKMLHMLHLQLPVQSLQELCELMSWTSLSLASLPQCFP